jgi:spore coat protein CotH
MILIKYKTAILLLLTILFLNCTEEAPNSTVELDNVELETNIDISDWTTNTHSKDADPNYDIVFPQDKVNRIDLVISSANWDIMIDDMTNNYGSFGSGSRGPADDSDDNPIYVPCSLFFNDIEWYQVGLRFKGNSSLKTTWGQGTWKLPLRLNMDRFEDEIPEISNQRFYGFKELSLSNGYDDESLIREKVVPEIFRDFGIVAPQTAFYRVYINYGDGPIYFGLYTMIEIVDDTMIEDQFAEDKGNIYKPEGTGASFSKNSFNTSDFEKKSNEETDWSDVEALYNTLHSPQRISAPETWRTSLEQVFNTDQFLKWLAVNTTIQNWDTYGRMTHNYYLYNNPQNNQLTWIPWDNNEALQTGKQGGAISISADEVSSNWPLIRYLLDDEVYAEKYKSNLKQVIQSSFSPSIMSVKYQYYANLIREYAVGENGEQRGYTFLESDGDFDSAISSLISHVSSRQSVVQNYIE